MITVQEVLKATKGNLNFGSKKLRFSSISTDSRTAQKNSLFIPLIGPRYDGHRFIGEALSKGALGTLTAKPLIALPPGKLVIQVKDTLKALQNLAFYHRQKFNLPIIGVTGSTGKTTTKDMIASILSQEKKTLKTDENYNNEIGVPLTLLKLNLRHKAAVIEMAMTGLGEIEDLARICRPQIAVITNIGLTHLERLKSVKKIAQAKSEILKFLKKGNFAVLPADDKFFLWLTKQAQKKGAKVISFGLKKKATITPSELKFPLPLPGRHIALDALAAVAVAKILRVKPKSTKNGLKRFKPSSHRMEIFTRKDGIRIIDDTYNANPHSMRAALEVLREQGPVKGPAPPRRIAVLGDMLELGSRAISSHREIGKLAARFQIDILIVIGKLSKYMAESAVQAGLKKVYTFSSNREAIKKLKTMPAPNDVILVKASRAMKLEEVVNFLDTSHLPI